MATPPQQGNTNLEGATGNVLAINADGSVNVVSEAASLTSGTLQSAAAANGNGTALSLPGDATVVFTVNMAAFTGTVNFEGSEDGTNFDTIEIDQSSSGTIASSVTGSTTTSIHTYVASVSGLQSVRARVSSFSAGTVTVTAHAAPETFNTHAINVAQLGGVAIPFGSADANANATIPVEGIVKYNGATWDRERIITKFVPLQAVALTHATPVDVYTPTTGKKFRLLGYHISATIASAIQFEDGTGTEVLRTPLLLAATPTGSPPMGNGILSGAANTHLFLDCTVTTNVSGWIAICEE